MVQKTTVYIINICVERAHCKSFRSASLFDVITQTTGKWISFPFLKNMITVACRVGWQQNKSCPFQPYIFLGRTEKVKKNSRRRYGNGWILIHILFFLWRRSVLDKTPQVIQPHIIRVKVNPRQWVEMFKIKCGVQQS